MNGKIFSLFLLTAILVSGLALAQVTVTSPNALSRSKNSTVMTVSNPSASAYNITLATPIIISDSAGNSISINPSVSAFELASGASRQITLSYSSVPSAFSLGTFSTPLQVRVTENASINASTILEFVESFCDFGNVGGNLSITTVKDEELDNEDSWEWAPLDNVEITVKVRNAGDEDLDATIEFGLYDPDTREFIDIDEDTIDLEVDEGKTEEAIITFRVPADIDEGSNYRFYVKAYDSERDECTDVKSGDYYQTVTINKETRAAVLDDISLESEYLCGDTVELRMRVYNTGEDEEDRVLVNLFNRELGLDLNKVIDDLDSGDYETITFTFKIPQNATEKTYNLDLKTYFKYDDDNSGCSVDSDKECYDKDSLDDLDKSFSAQLKIEGNCQAPAPEESVRVTALLDSESVAGEQIVIKATVTNTGEKTTSYTFSLSGIESFATLERIEPSALILGEDQSQDILVYLKASNSASGDYTFNIVSSFSGKTSTQPVTITVEPRTNPFSGLLSSLGDNWFIWVIVLINVVLIVLIIVVAIRISRG